MAIGEFDLIYKFFAQQKLAESKGVLLGIGDDCAITKVPTGHCLVTTTDTMVENSHFYSDIAPEDLAYKAIATNLSDLAAMGADPAWVSLALTLPKVDQHWLQRFSQGMFEILNKYQVALIGGDTTSVDIHSVTITAQGWIKPEQALCRHQAKVGDLIYVSGSLGDGLAGFHLLSEQQNNTKNDKSAVSFEQDFLIQRHLRPTPRIELGLALAKYQLSQCALDISDGLVGDLRHILERSKVSAVLNLENLPCSSALVSLYGREKAEMLALQGGEDYELCFTVAEDKQALLDQHLAELNLPYTCIGHITAHNPTQHIQFYRQGKNIDLNIGSFEHFK